MYPRRIAYTQQTADTLIFKDHCVVINDVGCLLKFEASKDGEVLNEIESVNSFDK